MHVCSLLIYRGWKSVGEEKVQGMRLSIRWVYDLLCVSLQAMVTLVSRHRHLVKEMVENMVSQLVGVAPV